MKALAQQFSIGSETWELVVWSRKNASVKLPFETFMDDRFDYQRRRSDPNPASRSILLV
jgi:hypothetical protein